MHSLDQPYQADLFSDDIAPSPHVTIHTDGTLSLFYSRYREDLPMTPDVCVSYPIHLTSENIERIKTCSTDQVQAILQELAEVTPDFLRDVREIGYWQALVKKHKCKKNSPLS